MRATAVLSSLEFVVYLLYGYETVFVIDIIYSSLYVKFTFDDINDHNSRVHVA
jgi:hypothetical protein